MFRGGFGKLCDKVGWRRTSISTRLRRFQTTELDSVVSEAQKHARMGWSTIHMTRHHTDAVSTEDRRAADRIGALLDEPK